MVNIPSTDKSLKQIVQYYQLNRIKYIYLMLRESIINLTAIYFDS